MKIRGCTEIVEHLLGKDRKQRINEEAKIMNGKGRKQRIE